VHFERNGYIVPASYANRPMSVHVYASRIMVVAEGQVVCEHGRIISRNHDLSVQTVYDWRTVFNHFCRGCKTPLNPTT